MLFSHFKRMFIFFTFITTVINHFSIAQEDIDDGLSLIRNSFDGNIETVMFLIDQGVDPNTKSANATPLTAAAIGYNFGIMKLLLQKGADPNPYRFLNERCTLIISLMEYHTSDDSLLFEAIRILLEGGANPNSHSGHLSNITALMPASEKAGSDGDYGEKSLELTRLLLEYHADPNERDEHGHTALMGAEFKAGAELLLAFGADPNMQANDGGTALMHASRIGNLDLINTLLEWGADPGIPDNEGNTATILAKNQEVSQYLENWRK